MEEYLTLAHLTGYAFCAAPEGRWGVSGRPVGVRPYRPGRGCSSGPAPSQPVEGPASRAGHAGAAMGTLCRSRDGTSFSPAGKWERTRSWRRMKNTASNRDKARAGDGGGGPFLVGVRRQGARANLARRTYPSFLNAASRESASVRSIRETSIGSSLIAQGV